jgi:hypothetical protein
MYNNQFISQLKAQRANFVEQINHIDAMLKLSGIDLSDADFALANSIEPTSNTRPYGKDASYQQKIASLLKQQNRFLSMNEMAGLINQYEPKISIDEAKKSLGSAKNLLLKSRTIVKFQVDKNNSNSFYGSPSWVDENGIPREENRYKESALQTKAKVEI